MTADNQEGQTIEFHCRQCGKLLQVSQEVVGRRGEEGRVGQRVGAVVHVAFAGDAVTQGAVLFVGGLTGVRRGGRRATPRGEGGEGGEGPQGARASKAASLSNA